jgi:hypothetical protein
LTNHSLGFIISFGKRKEIKEEIRMFEEVSFQMYTIYSDYEKYCHKQKKEGKEPVSFFKYAFGQY